MRKPNIRNIGASIGAAAITVVEPGANKVEAIGHKVGAHAKSAAANYRETKAAIIEESEVKAKVKAQAKATELVVVE